jgi:hypothetical protein
MIYASLLPCEDCERSQQLRMMKTSLIRAESAGRCRHASIRTLKERIVSLGACWAFSVQPVLPSVWRAVVLISQSGTWARPLTQSPELGFGLFDFLFRERF